MSSEVLNNQSPEQKNLLVIKCHYLTFFYFEMDKRTERVKIFLRTQKNILEFGDQFAIHNLTRGKYFSH